MLLLLGFLGWGNKNMKLSFAALEGVYLPLKKTRPTLRKSRAKRWRMRVLLLLFGQLNLLL